MIEIGLRETKCGFGDLTEGIRWIDKISNELVFSKNKKIRTLFRLLGKRNGNWIGRPARNRPLT